MPPNAGKLFSNPVAISVESLVLRGRADEAWRTLETALASDPDHKELRLAKALLFLYTGREPAAAKILIEVRGLTQSEKLAEIAGHHLQSRLTIASLSGSADPEALTLITELKSAFPTLKEGPGVSISACLIVKNEAKNLPRCLRSLEGIVDEIIVVDTGSSDDSIAIAESFGAKCAQVEWTHDFSAARNRSLELATGDWILWIDADEEIAAGSQPAFQRAVTRPQFGGFAIEIVNFTEDGSDVAQYVHRPIRLFRRVPGIQFSGRIHEQVAPSIEGLGLPWAHLDGARLLHHGYRPAEMSERKKLDRTIDMVAREVENDPTNAFQWFNLANAYTAANRFEEAATSSEKCVDLLVKGDPIGPLVYQLWTNACLKLGDAVQSLAICDRADNEGFGGILNEFERANACLALGRIEEGLVAANRSMAYDWPRGMTGDITIAQYKRFITRGQLLALNGDFAEAIAMLDRALRANPTYGPAIYSRAATFEKSGQFEQALEGFLSGQENPQVGQMCLKGAGRVCTRLGLPKRASELYCEAWRRDLSDHEAWIGWVQAAESYGDLPTILEAYTSYAESFVLTADMLVNWGRALDAAGNEERATACYQEAITREPNNANAYFNLGDLLYKTERFHEAADTYQAGLKVDPQNASGWFVLGNALARLGVLQGARVSYLQALALRPDYPEAIYNLDLIRTAA